jgi:putative hydrolase of the HAD superfamily
MPAASPMIPAFDVIAFDADDTLWHNESYFAATEDRFLALVAPFVTEDALDDLPSRLHATEIRNLRLFGYGVKGFTLSMIETAIEVTDGAVPASAIQTLIDLGREILDHPVELLPGVTDVIDELSGHHRLIVVTKGDLLHQESKVASSGIADRFTGVEIVSEKDVPTYSRIVQRWSDGGPARFCMVGNSVRSDVLPLLELGATAIHIPYELTWAHERVDGHDGTFPVLDSITELPTWLRTHRP